jgi:protein SMG8
MISSNRFFADACIHGYDLALSHYSELLPHHYSSTYHEGKLEAAIEVFHKYARGPNAHRLEEKLRDNCESIWLNGKQQCEHLSLRGNPCIMIAKHLSIDGSMHSSGIIFVSTCNCGRTQGRREDPYTIRKANYEFYQLMTASCATCDKAEVIEFPTFVPSIKEFKAAEFSNKNLTSLILSECSNKTPNDDKGNTEHQLHLSASQKTQQSESDLSLGSSISDEERTSKNKSKQVESDDDDDEINEIVVKIGELDVKEEQAEASTTEYLPGMLLITSPPGLLPQFPSWSLLCVGSASFYSHNTGLTEHQMPGFLSGTNFLLPWDVKVRLEHAQSWAESYEKNRSRKKQKQLSNQPGASGTFFTLKIFVGVEYECSRGHRFMMSSNSTVLRGTSGGSRSNGCGSKVVFSDMPLYFPCPCKNAVAQLMRVHIVTPKAPVNINIEPKIRIRRETEMIFTSGWNEPSKLSQSTYWVLRLPYIYQGENEAVPSPLEVPATTDALRYGCLVQGMFGIKENENGDE